jgi:hypothetical protein
MSDKPIENENLVNRLNLDKFKKLSPTGYEFSKKPLTQLAKARLGGYWLQTVNYNEKKEEMKEVKSWSTFDIEWLNKYQEGQMRCFYYLKNNGFLKIKK